jgi:ABC-type Fe3+/spermidine/putrescine transport system ATPase subunit
VADRVAVLRDGAIDQHGPPEEVWDRPRNAAVAALLGEMNRLPGTVEAVQDDIALVRLACGPLMEALLGRTLQPGDPCVLMVRPDRVALAPVPAAEMGEGAIDGTLIEARFDGSSWRLRLLVGSGAALMVRRPAASGLRGLSVGQTAALAWQPHHAWAFPVRAA